MKSSFFRSSLCALCVVTAGANATVTEPNGLVVPTDSDNGEQQLYSLFSSRSETFDWLADAHTTPNKFSPLCGFTATYVLNEAGSHFGLAWYNDTGTKPQAADLHVLVPTNSPVGTSFSGTSIKSDPAYTGGLVGFALVGGETHYSNPAYNNVCTACSTPAPWVTAVIYSSTVTANAYYLCFEDGQTTNTGWINDGDFNDDVYFVTGVSCEGGGQPCSVGTASGICAPGLSQCGAAGITCRQVNQPRAEACNGLDDNCNGKVDDGAPCPASQNCFQGACVNACAGEFGCLGGKMCHDNFCVDPECVTVSCDAGLVCTAGACRGPCDGVVCPGAQLCRVGRCVDPCVDVVCETGQVCSGGTCVTGCDCQPCPSGKACDSATKRCVEPSCASVTCTTGTSCVSGQCVADCSRAVCPAGQQCTAGACVPAPPRDGGGVTSADGGRLDGGLDGGATSGDGGSTDAGVGGVAATSGCNCGSTELHLMVLMAAFTLALRRRKWSLRAP